MREILRAVWVVRVRYGPSIGLAGAPAVTVVVLSYRRQGNIDPILRSAGRCRFVQRIVMSNNDPEQRAADFVRFDDPRLELIDQPRRRRPGVRWGIARDRCGDDEVVVCIDDDVFLFPRQLRGLVQATIAEPEAVHGIAGQLGDQYVKGRDATVDYVMRVYALTGTTVRRYFQLVGAMPQTGSEVERIGDDIVVSLSAPAAPRIHDLGFVLSCRSSLDAEVAVNQEADFLAVRSGLFDEATRARELLR